MVEVTSVSSPNPALYGLFQGFFLTFVYRLLAAVFVISMAKDTPTLTSLVPDFEELIEQAILCTEPWAQHHETADAILGIFQAIQRKLRFPPVKAL